MNVYLRAAIFLAFVGCCTAIECYQCAFLKVKPSAGDMGCDEGDEFNAKNITKAECNGVCQKTVLMADSETAYEIYRGCVDECDTSDRYEIDCCDTNLCNAATPLKAAGLTAALLVATGIVAATTLV